MKRIVVAAGVAAVVSAALAIRKTAATRSTISSTQTADSGTTPEAEAQFRQRIRAIIQKVEADVRKG